MPKHNDGGRAFPGGLATTVLLDEGEQVGGMSLLDYFAGQALIGLVVIHGISEFAPVVNVDSYAHSDFNANFIATQAYVVANAMLKAREA